MGIPIILVPNPLWDSKTRFSETLVIDANLERKRLTVPSNLGFQMTGTRVCLEGRKSGVTLKESQRNPAVHCTVVSLVLDATHITCIFQSDWKLGKIEKPWNRA